MSRGRRALRTAIHRETVEQASKFEIGQRVRVVCDHDGPRGRWVGVVGRTTGFDWSGVPFPWRVEAPSGAQMYCSADMLETGGSS